MSSAQTQPGKRGLGRAADRARAQAVTATQKALAAKREADRLEAEFRQRTRDLMGESPR